MEVRKLIYKKRIKNLLIFFGLGAVYVSINTALQVFFDVGLCPVNLIFGIPCPACGLSRAALAFFRLDVQTAFFMHPLFLFIAVSGVVFAILYLKKGFNALENKKIVFIYSATLIICYIVRMALYYPNAAPMDFNPKSLLGVIIEAFN